MPDRIRIALVKSLRGEHAHVKPLIALEALTAAQARQRPRRGLATIWEQLAHMVFWQDIMLARLRGEAPPYPKSAADGWPPMPPARDAVAEWADLVAHFANGLKTAQRFAKTTDLARIIRTKTKRTTVEQLIALAQHNSYHVGQIVTVRRMLGLWPPPSGGDTW
ncbi:MAG: DinB family protein [Candidatus Zixiibacteriota bacterium]